MEYIRFAFQMCMIYYIFSNIQLPAWCDVAFSELKQCPAEAIIACQANGERLAILTRPKNNREIDGNSLQVWQLGKNQQPIKILFQSSHRDLFGHDLFWQGNSLLYCTIDGISSEKQYIDMLMNADDNNTLEELAQKCALHAWSATTGTDTIICTGLFDGLISSNNPNAVLAIDPYNALLKYTKEQNNTPKDFPTLTHVLQIIDIPSGSTKNTLVSLSTEGPVAPPDRNQPFTPILVTADKQMLIGVVNSAFPSLAQAQGSRLENIMLGINLTTGKAQAITSEQKVDKLLISQLHPHALALPAPILEGTQLVCRLDNNGRRAFSIHLAYFSPDGTLLKERMINTRELMDAGISFGNIITWTPDGQGILLQYNGAVWLFDITTKSATQIASGISVKEVYQWVQNRHLLVKIQKQTDTKHSEETMGDHKISSDQAIFGDALYWGFLDLPETAKESGK